MRSIKLTNTQFLSVSNILKSQSIPLKDIDSYLGVMNTIKNPTIKDNIYEISISDQDLEIMLSIIENGTILIKEIPFALNLIKSLTTQVESIDESQTKKVKSDSKVKES